MVEGWIKIHRKILSNGIWKKPMDFRLFFLLVLNATFDKVEIDDIIINRGQYLRSYRQLQNDLAFINNNRVIQPSLSALKRSVEHLVDLKMIATLETKLGTLFTIVNYEKYQSDFKNLTEQKAELGTELGTEHGTPPEHPENNNKKDKKDKNEIKKEREGTPSLDEVKKYFQEQGFSEEEALKFYDKYDAVGWKIKGDKIENFEALARKSWFPNVERFNKNENQNYSSTEFKNCIYCDKKTNMIIDRKPACNYDHYWKGTTTRIKQIDYEF